MRTFRSKWKLDLEVQGVVLGLREADRHPEVRVEPERIQQRERTESPGADHFLAPWRGTAAEAMASSVGQAGRCHVPETVGIRPDDADGSTAVHGTVPARVPVWVDRRGY